MAAQENAIKAAKPIAPPLKLWLMPVIAGWVIPGAGHFILKKQGRGALLLACVTLMFLFGLLMRGYMFTPQSGDPLTTLINYGGFVCNLASGALYAGAMMFGYTQPDVAGHVHDYGTKFLVTAGLLNILAMVDVYEIAAGEKRLMPRMALSHFEAAFLFSLFTSVVLGITTKKTSDSQLKYGAYCFGYFLVALFGIGWLMKLGHG